MILLLSNKEEIIMSYNYRYALTYVDYDDNNKDVIYFKTDNDKELYFNLSSLFDNNNKKYFNFEKRDLIDIKIVIDNTENNAINEEYGINYLIIKEENTNFYYYYFINKITYDNYNKVIILAHLDIFTTYFNKFVFEGTITRHTAREFTNDGADIVYDTREYTHVFAVDDTYKGKKFLQADKTLHPHVYTYLDTSILDTWLEENVEAWQYIYVDTAHQYKYDNTPYRNADEFMSDGVISGYGVLAMPIYKNNGTNNIIFVRFRDVSDVDNPHTYNIGIRDNALDYFRNANNDNEYIYSSKISKQPPFTPIISNSDIYNFRCTITDSGHLIMDFGDVNSVDLSPLLQSFTRVFITHAIDSYSYTAMIEMSFQTKRYYNNNVSSLVSNYIKTRFSKAEYLNWPRDYYKQPNATSLKNIELKITYNGQEYSTSPSKIDTSNAIIEMLEIINADISKTYVRWKPTGYYAFTNANNKTLTGGTFSDDTSISLANTKLAEVLANSKNFFLQKRVNIGANASLSLFNNYVNGDLLGFTNSLAKEQLSEVNYGYDVDNIENAPSHLDKASGSSLFNLLTKDYGLHLEIWMLTMEDLDNISTYYAKYGVSTTLIGTQYDFLEKHKYYDYVEMDVFYIHDSTLKIPYVVKNEFIKKLKRGVRFWYENLYNYSSYNYERALE